MIFTRNLPSLRAAEAAHRFQLEERRLEAQELLADAFLARRQMELWRDEADGLFGHAIDLFEALTELVSTGTLAEERWFWLREDHQVYVDAWDRIEDGCAPAREVA